MREIKFEYMLIKDGIVINKQILTLEDIEQKDSNEFCYELLEQNEKVIKRQYTGLKDKNDVEIYEGDIIRSHNSRQGEKIEDYEVIYAGSGFCIKSLKENEIHSKGTLYSFALYSDNIDFLKDDYIIGNIYENQELLN